MSRFGFRGPWCVLAWIAPIGAALAAIARFDLPIGSPWFMAAMAGAAVAYAAAAWHVSHLPSVSLRLAVAGVMLGSLARAPLLTLPDAFATDAIRYVWDARVQRAGLDPYRTRPDDPAVAHIHTALTRGIDAAWLPTIYPPVAQLYFRAVTAVSESLLAFRVAAVVSDAAVAAALVAILHATGGPLSWAVLYAWHPVMMFESAASGHLDFAGALALTLSCLAFTTGRTAWGATLFTMSTLVKPLPLVLLPLLWRAGRWRDWCLAGACAVAALLAITGGAVPDGSMGTFVDRFRFNGPVFGFFASWIGARPATAFAVAAGIAVAVLCAKRPRASAVDDWAWPMAAALVCAPVVYPWYFAWFVPFLATSRSRPLLVWSLSIIAVYPVWHVAVRGGHFRVPPELLALEFGLPLLAWVAWRTTRPPMP